MNALLRLIFGILLLIFGRSLFWLFVAAIGFLAGASFAAQALPGQPEWVVLAVAIAVGVAGALLALLVPTAIGIIAGFVAGAYFALNVMTLMGANLGNLLWVPLVIGGIAGAAIVLLLFDWAIVALSALAGAVTIVSLLGLHGVVAIVIAAVLFIVGVAVQTGLARMRPRRVAT